MTDVEDRLYQDGAEWRMHWPAAPSFPTALAGAVLDPSGQRQRRHSTQLAATAAAVIAVVTAALMIGHLHRAGNTSSTTVVAPASRTAKPDCPPLPRSSGHYANSVDVTIVAPTDATTGSSVSVDATLTAIGEPITLPDAAQPAAVFLLRDGTVMAHSSPQRGTGYKFELSNSPRTLPTAPLQLATCTAQHDVSVSPAGRDATPLPAGTYQLVAAFEPDERTDDVIVSDSITIQITR